MVVRSTPQSELYRFGHANISEISSAIRAKKKISSESYIESSEAKRRRLSLNTQLKNLQKDVHAAEKDHRSFGGSDFMHYMMMMREDSERRAEMRRQEDERRYEWLREERENQYKREKEEREERRREEKREEEQRRLENQQNMVMMLQTLATALRPQQKSE